MSRIQRLMLLHFFPADVGRMDRMPQICSTVSRIQRLMLLHFFPADAGKMDRMPPNVLHFVQIQRLTVPLMWGGRRDPITCRELLRKAKASTTMEPGFYSNSPFSEGERPYFVFLQTFKGSLPLGYTRTPDVGPG